MTQHGDDHGHAQPPAHGGDHGHGHEDHTHPAPPPEPARKAPPGAVLIGFLVLLAGELLILGHSGISFPAIQPENISTYGADVDHLFYLILGITGFFFLLTEGLLIYFLMKYRARPGEKARHTHGNHALELLWSLIPGVILFGLAIFQTSTWAEIKFKSSMPGEKECFVVQVIGKQFEWHTRYAGKDGRFGTADDVTVLGELHVPVNRKVIVKLHTLDVLHSFWLPNVRLKQDLLPGLTIPGWFEATKTGTFEWACAELCGIGHTKMGASLIVQSEADLASWMESQLKNFGPHDPKKSKEWNLWKD